MTIVIAHPVVHPVVHVNPVVFAGPAALAHSMNERRRWEAEREAQQEQARQYEMARSTWGMQEHPQASPQVYHVVSPTIPASPPPFTVKEIVDGLRTSSDHYELYGLRRCAQDERPTLNYKYTEDAEDVVLDLIQKQAGVLEPRLWEVARQMVQKWSPNPLRTAPVVAPSALQDTLALQIAASKSPGALVYLLDHLEHVADTPVILTPKAENAVLELLYNRSYLLSDEAWDKSIALIQKYSCREPVSSALIRPELLYRSSGYHFLVIDNILAAFELQPLVFDQAYRVFLLSPH